jgi:tetratricopeptide (TPR) repeat protein
MPAAERLSAGMVDPMARMRMWRGQYGVAAARLRRELAEDPGSLDKETLLGIAEAKNGAFPDAFVAFESARLADGYDGEAIEAHADVLRALGRPGDAARLRMEKLPLTTSFPMAELQVFLDLVDDHRSDRDLESAFDAATMAIAIAPDRGAPYAQLAEVWMDLGRWDAARGEIQVADQLGPRSTYIARASIRLLIHENELDEASEIAATATGDNESDLVLRAARAELSTISGDATDAVRLTQGKRFPDSVQPQMLLAAMHAFGALGDTERARDAATRFRSIYTRPVINALGSLEYPPPSP